MPCGSCMMARNRRRFSGSLRQPAFITVRALYNPRSVRGDRPFTPGVRWYSRKVSRIACGSRS
ncbi:hypothetical protein D9M68_932610 [compost metagenome]